MKKSLCLARIELEGKVRKVFASMGAETVMVLAFKGGRNHDYMITQNRNEAHVALCGLILQRERKKMHWWLVFLYLVLVT